MQLTAKRKFFSVIIALSPLLGSYKSPIRGMDSGTFLLVLFFAVYAKKGKIYMSDISGLLIYVFVQTPFLLNISRIETSVSIIVLRYLKFIVVLGIAFLFGLANNLYSEKYTFCTIKFVCYVSAIFIIMQRLAFIFGRIVFNPFISFASSDLYLSSSMVLGTLFRPSAFFLEPAHMASYGIVFLCYSLFKSKNLKDAVVISAAVLCTGSGIGLVAVTGEFAIYILLLFKARIIKALQIMTLIGGAMYIFSRTLFFQQVVERFTTANVGGGSNAISGRIGLGYSIFADKEFLYKLLGTGYGNVPEGVYLNGVAYVINTLGVIGLCIYIYLLFKSIVRGKLWQQVGVSILIILTIFAQVFNPVALVFYFCIYRDLSKYHELST